MKFFSVVLMVAGVCAAAEPSATVDLVDQTDASKGKIVVHYTLRDADAIVTARLFTNGVAVAEKDATSLIGDVNRLVKIGEGDTNATSFAWYMKHDIPDFPACDVSVELALWSPTNPPDYMSVNLQTASSITYYVSTNALPGGLDSDIWRTSQLLMRKIKAKGVTFPMGKNTPDTSRIREHAVTLTNDFYIGVFELTQAQLVNIDGRNRYYSTSTYKWTQTNKFANVACAATRPADNLLWRTLRGDSLGYRYPTDFQVDDWSILGRLRAKSGLMIDLPTEAMWEFACRGGSESQCFNTDLGLTINDVSRNRSNGGCSDASGGAWPFDVAADKGTARVGSYAPNAYGLYDMYGNVNEICLDRYAALTDGRAAVDPLGDRSSGTHVARGGNCMSEAKWLTSAMRMGPDIKGMTSPNPSDLYGARLALRLP